MKTIENFIALYEKEKYKMSPGHTGVWEKAYLPTQLRKSVANQLTELQQKEAFKTLINRGVFIKEMFKFFNFNNFAEVGTAEGYQFYVMADYLSQHLIDGFAYSCDIRDARSNNFVDKYNTAVFTKGNSMHMAEKIMNDNRKIDLYWIDGNHDKGAVLYDVIRLSKTQSKDCIWVFDDYNTRFGAFHEMRFLSRFGKSIELPMGITASGNPNNLLIVQGRL